MQINITGHHVDITDAIREAVNTKMKKIQQQFPDATSFNVIATVEKHEQVAEVSTHYLGQDVSAKAKADDLYQAINEMANKLTSLMKRQKEKVKSHSHEKLQQVEEIEPESEIDED
jgi:putative sigma-54 modulation protein